jgi:hypothetical protein
MKKFQILVIICVALALAAPVWAGNRPEYDAVGCDYCNGFAATSLKYVVVNSFSLLNFRSDFTNTDADKNTDNEEDVFGRVYEDTLYTGKKWESKYDEWFYTSAGQLFLDTCYGKVGDCNTGRILSALTDPWNDGIYEWQIVLQMKPESDLNINIFDCVTKHNTFDIAREAEQTGRYRADWGQLFFVQSANPSVTAVAFAGPFATQGFPPLLILDARMMPSLGLMALNQALYTSKAHWEEGLVVKLPQTGEANTSGQTEVNLKQGDKIFVRVAVPGNNAVDLRYGPSNVIVKYIGVIGQEYYGDPCFDDPPSVTETPQEG